MNNLQFLPKINKATLVPMAVQPPKRLLTSIDFGGLLGQFMKPEGLAMLGLMAGLLIVSKLVGNGKGKITSGRLCGTAKKLAATGSALKQMKEKNGSPLLCGAVRRLIGLKVVRD